MIKHLVLKNRSFRRFYEDEAIKREKLRELIDIARLTPSAANRQPLKYIISNQQQQNQLIFPHLKWAGYLQDWEGPAPGERPSAYIIVLGDTRISENYWADPGIAIQSIMLAAVEKGLGGCILGAIDREGLRQKLEIDSRYQILYVLALGKPRESVVLEKAQEKDDIKYWRDKYDKHHVPKRPLESIILK